MTMTIILMCILGWLLIGISFFTILMLKSEKLSYKDFSTMEILEFYFKFALLGPLSIFIIIFIHYIEQLLYKNDGNFKIKDD